MSFDISALFRPGLPAPAAAPFTTFPRYNFVGGHNDSDGVPYVGVRLGDDGIDMAHLVDVLEAQKQAGTPVKFIYTIPTVQNPTGSVMPIAQRCEMLDIAARYGGLIFEDDCYADVVWTGERPPTMRAMDAEAAKAEGRANRVIYCGSFSKSVAPALRIGFIMADWPVIAQILPLKTDAGTGALDQMVLAEFCQAHFAEHIVVLRARLKAKCDITIQALEENFGTSAEFRAPQGGIFIWVTLPETVDTTRLGQVAMQDGIAINPGAEWTVNGAKNRNRMRLCFGHPGEDEIKEGIARLAAICHREFGVPERISNSAQT